MDRKKIAKETGRFIGWLALLFCSFLVKIIPGKCVYAFASFIGVIAYRVAGKQRKTALESLTIAFGTEKTPEQIKEIARECFIRMGKAAVELFYLLERPALIKERMRIEGKHFLDEALAQKKGVILVSAHFGNFPLMLARLSLEGYSVAGIMRPMRDKRVEKIFLSRRDFFGIKTLYSQPRRKCVVDSISLLRNNVILFIPLDQNFGTGGIFVDFFGRKAATATGPVVLAQRTGALILPAFIVRQPDNTHIIHCEKAMTVTNGEAPQETVAKNVQAITSIIETYIRRYPSEWAWIHRRWKTQAPDYSAASAQSPSG
jgi:Kdo2-lipid IVA lauroyltransferase/acyltransferase